jgi:Tfp pilus assembly pilus retraction ATPase PilT
LIHRYLNQPKSSGSRHPHRVTFEDPIERQYLRFATDKKTGAFAVAIAGNQDYTPREKYRDVPSLRSALTDALRQTPKVFFVGETRNKRDWELLLEFAGTGHLIVTTSHASSLVEAMHRIFEARKAVTAADRNEVASRLLGVVHLRSDELEDGPKILYPSLWRRTPRGIAALTSDGLAALLPHRTREGVDSAISCLGSCFIVEQLVNGIEDSEASLKKAFVDAQMKALQVDLIGA